jgi:hypothetical protein
MDCEATLRLRNTAVRGTFSRFAASSDPEMHHGQPPGSQQVPRRRAQLSLQQSLALLQACPLAIHIPPVPSGKQQMGVFPLLQLYCDGSPTRPLAQTPTLNCRH